jgi:putative ABC transport system permease protein
MLKNYFIVALRNFWRNKTFSLINIIGLAIGISAALVIFLIVSYDLSFDHFEKDHDRIYRLTSVYTWKGQTGRNGEVCVPFPAAVQKEATGIDVVAPFHTWDETQKTAIPYPDPRRPLILKKQQDIIFADARYFDIFTYTWLSGSAKSSLTQPYQVVLTESKAKLFFPGLSPTDIIGKTIIFDDTVTTTVTGIVKDIQQNTDFYFKVFVSRATIETPRLKPMCFDQWGCINSSDQAFVRLSVGNTPQHLIPQLNKIFTAHSPHDPNDEGKSEMGLQPLGDLHFDGTYGGNFDNGRTAHKPTLYGLLAVGAFLLLLACINFVNLTTAQASQRAKEIGIRKTMGSQRRQLAFQFLNETFLLTFVATLLSTALTPLLLKVFGDFIPKDLHFNLLHHPEIFGFLLILIAVVSLLSGFYPALVMSAFKPVLVLKNQAYANTATTRSALLRKSLTVSQFVIAQVFIIGTILVSWQISYALHKDLGFKKEAILYFRTNYYSKLEKRDVLLARLRSIPGIAGISLSTDPPTSNGMWGTRVTYKDGKKEIKTDIQVKKADSNYLGLFGMKLVAGKDNPQSDTPNSILVNENYAHTIGFTDARQAVGAVIEWDRKIRIAGVLADFHQRSLHEPIKPSMIANGIGDARNINIALQPQPAGGSAWSTTIAKIERAFRSVYPEDDFDYQFVDDTVAKFYTAEKNTARLLYWCTGLAIFISCLGLLGLVIFITNQRTKEIGIRKVIGATVPQIVLLLSRDFMKLIVLAILIALPIAWWGSHKWLENFAYTATLSWWIFAAGGAALFGIALAILCLRAFRAASANPVNALRSE